MKVELLVIVVDQETDTEESIYQKRFWVEEKEVEYAYAVFE